jgi:hypothetical protein
MDYGAHFEYQQNVVYFQVIQCTYTHVVIPTFGVDFPTSTSNQLSTDLILAILGLMSHIDELTGPDRPPRPDISG